ncbi:MAG: hypothetical protein V3U96_03665 [Paracoccaceae bacterium]
MLNEINKFWYSSAGAVTVDWVFLTALLMSVAIVISASVFGGALDMTINVGNAMDSVNPDL